MGEYRMQKYLCGVEVAETIMLAREQTFLSLATTTVDGLKANSCNET